MFYVVCAKTVQDDETFVKLSSVFLGGFGGTQDEAGLIARDCTNSYRGILVKIYEGNGIEELPGIMKQASEWFKKRVDNMQIASQIISRPYRKGK